MKRAAIYYVRISATGTGVCYFDGVFAGDIPSPSQLADAVKDADYEYLGDEAAAKFYRERAMAAVKSPRITRLPNLAADTRYDVLVAIGDGKTVTLRVDVDSVPNAFVIGADTE